MISHVFIDIFLVTSQASSSDREQYSTHQVYRLLNVIAMYDE